MKLKSYKICSSSHTNINTRTIWSSEARYENILAKEIGCEVLDVMFAGENERSNTYLNKQTNDEYKQPDGIRF